MIHFLQESLQQEMIRLYKNIQHKCVMMSDSTRLDDSQHEQIHFPKHTHTHAYAHTLSLSLSNTDAQKHTKTTRTHANIHAHIHKYIHGYIHARMRTFNICNTRLYKNIFSTKSVMMTHSTRHDDDSQQ